MEIAKIQKLMLKVYKKIIGLVLVSAFVAVIFSGLNMGMDRRQDGAMSGCVFNQSTVCPMGYQEHINHWQGIFVAVQPAQNSLFVFLVLITLGGTALPFFQFFKWRIHTQEAYRPLQSIRKLREMMAKLSDHILQALSDGTLNPKLYNFVKVIG